MLSTRGWLEGRELGAGGGGGEKRVLFEAVLTSHFLLFDNQVTIIFGGGVGGEEVGVTQMETR